MRIVLALAASLLAAPALADPLDPVDLRVMVRTEAVQRGLAPEIADAVATIESGYQPTATCICSSAAPGCRCRSRSPMPMAG
jgi:hypothetical protein